jgi:hypothetical protein
MCFYNFLCSHPVFGLSDFNHVFSNIGYVLLGLLFVMVVHRRESAAKDSALGLPQQFGLFYAMGIALMAEGLLSACYHICPNKTNFQFGQFNKIITLFNSLNKYIILHIITL